MTFTAIYTGLFLLQLARGKCKSAKCLGIGAAVCVLHQLLVSVFVDSQYPDVLIQSCLFMLATGWAYCLDYIKSKAAVIGYGFVLFQMSMVFDAYSTPNASTSIYEAYSYIVIAINMLIITACMTETDDDRNIVVVNLNRWFSRLSQNFGVSKK